MVSEQVFILLLAVLVTQTDSQMQKIKGENVSRNPLALIDDANNLLDELSQSILGHILTAHDKLEDQRYDVTSHTINVRLQAEIDIQQEYQTLQAELNSMKELAQTAHADITWCLLGNEDQLEIIPNQYLDQINQCISSRGAESDTVLSDSRYKIDVTINEVQRLSFALGQCSLDEKCISNIIDIINDDSNNLPLQIEAEVQNASDDLAVVKVRIQDCSTSGLASYVQEGSGIILAITDCVNSIIS